MDSLKENSILEKIAAMENTVREKQRDLKCLEVVIDALVTLLFTKGVIRVIQVIEHYE